MRYCSLPVGLEDSGGEITGFTSPVGSERVARVVMAAPRDAGESPGGMLRLRLPRLLSGFESLTQIVSNYYHPSY